ncbi:tol-pal system protein YbgF [Hydrogenophaga aquatica]
MNSSRYAFRSAAACLAASLVMLVPMQAQAALFGDDEARRAILDLRNRVEANRQAAENANRELAEQLKSLVEDNGAPTRRALLDIVNQIEALRAELAQLRGQNERIARELAEIQQRQKDTVSAVDERLRVLEPVKVTVDGQEFLAQPEEKAAFESAMDVLRSTDFPRAAQLYGQFIQRYPSSGYVPVALYWQGNAYYAARNYKEAVASYQRLIARTPGHPRVPEAKLAIANCQLELKDVKAARATLQELVKAHPDTEAGATAKDRLARMK